MVWILFLCIARVQRTHSSSRKCRTNNEGKKGPLFDPFLSIQRSPISFNDSLTNKCKKEGKKNSHSVYLTNTIYLQNITLGTTSKNGGLVTSFYLRRFSKSIIGPCSSFFSEVVVVFLFVFFFQAKKIQYFIKI